MAHGPVRYGFADRSMGGARAVAASRWLARIPEVFPCLAHLTRSTAFLGFLEASAKSRRVRGGRPLIGGQFSAVLVLDSGLLDVPVSPVPGRRVYGRYSALCKEGLKSYLSSADLGYSYIV